MRATLMLSLTIASFASGALGNLAAEPRPTTPDSRHSRGPGVRIWLSGDDVYRRNERARVYYRVERDAFVTILRVDTDGRVRVLFPRHPDDDNYAEAGRSYVVSGWDRGTTFIVDDYPGVGYVFAIASSTPFDFRMIHDGDRWTMRHVTDGRIHGDPRSSLEEIMLELLPQDYDDFDTHIAAYHVERRYDYPRFVCYDCHAYVPFYTWNPYYSWCRSYTLVVWNDPWYYHPSYWYPTRYYGGRRVVYTYRSAPARYVFRERQGSVAGVDYRRRDVATYVRRPEDRGVRAADIGTVGGVPVPRTPERRYAPDRIGGPDDSPRDQPRDQPREPGNPRDDDDRRDRGNNGVGDRSGGGRTDNRGRDQDPQPGDGRQAEPRRRGSEPGIEIVPDRSGRGTPRATDRPQQVERPQPADRPREVDRPRTERSAPEARPERSRPESTRPAPAPQARPERSRPEPSRPEPRAEPRQQPRPEPPSSRQPSGDAGSRRRQP